MDSANRMMLRQAIGMVAEELGISFDEAEQMPWEEFLAVIQRMKDRTIAEARLTTVSEEQEITVPSWITTTWDEHGRPDEHKRIEECTVEEIKAYVLDLQRQGRELHDAAHNLVLYVANLTETVDSASDDSP